jgi:extradiol dioxygenase family protein
MWWSMPRRERERSRVREDDPTRAGLLVYLPGYGLVLTLNEWSHAYGAEKRDIAWPLRPQRTRA